MSTPSIYDKLDRALVHKHGTRWDPRDIYTILITLKKLPYGYQGAFLAKLKLTTTHIYYWRKRYGFDGVRLVPIIKELEEYIESVTAGAPDRPERLL